ncbi:putative tRNA pseudouridine synthase Pus10 [Rhizoclosmatium sp. JEL0117]|nr:putative tRNA pseudouridine synthase Pus10 [Rhizoclosmatium sp. JEL0117]
MEFLTPAILTLLPSNASEISDHLRANNLCDRCILRVLGVRKATLFASSNLGTSHSCPTCFGLLQPTTSTSVALKITSKIRDEHWSGLTSFFIAPHLPIQLALRSRAIDLLLSTNNLAIDRGVSKRVPKKFDRNQSNKANSDRRASNKANHLPQLDPADNQLFSVSQRQIDVKDALAMMVAHEVSRVTGLVFDPKAAFHVELAFEHRETENEFEWVREQRKRTRQDVPWRKPVESGGDIVLETWNQMVNAAMTLDYQDFVREGYIPFKPVNSECVCTEIKLVHLSLFVAGRYNKYSREISNARMEYNGERLVAESVEELIGEHLDLLFHADGHNFASSGREDVDVLMLGSGRPFYMELVNPKKLDISQNQVRIAQEQINKTREGKIRVAHLQLVEKDETKHLKNSASTKRKSYSTLIQLSKPVTLHQLNELSNMKDLALKQQTPIRVMRSRSDLERDKVVHEMNVYPENEGVLRETGEYVYDLIRIDLTTSAGTYVKEFCHSDGGRTVPSIKELLGVESATVVALDVLQVFLDWPKETE